MFQRQKSLCLVIILHIALLSGCVSTGQKKASPDEIARANINLAAEYFRLGRLEPALNSAKKAIAADPESITGNSLIALIYQRLDQPGLAEEYFSTAVELVAEDTSEYGVIHNNYGVFLCQNNRLLDADESFSKAANNKLYQTPQDAFENAGLCAINGGRWEMAEEHFRKALKLAPKKPRSLIGMAKIQYNAKKYLLSRAYLQRYHAVSKGNAASLLLALKVERELSADNEVKRLKKELQTRFPESEEAKSLLK